MATKKKPTKKSTKKSNVSRSAQLTQFKFKWWMAIVLVGVIAGLGIVILRFSNASGGDGFGKSQYLDAASFRHSNSVYQQSARFSAVGGGFKTYGIYHMQSSSSTYRQIWGPYLNLPWSKYIDICYLVNTTRSDTKVHFDVTAWEGKVELANRDNVSLAGYVNKTVPGFGYPGYCIQNIPVGNYHDGIEFRANVNYGDMNFNGVTYRQHN